MTAPVPAQLRRFIWDMQSMVELGEGDREILFVGRDLMSRLVADAQWLPPAFSCLDRPLCQFQLYADALEQFCVVASVLAPGAHLPIVREPAFEIVGVLSGAITRQRFAVSEAGLPTPHGRSLHLSRGQVDAFTPKSADALGTANASATAPAVIIQVHGVEISAVARAAFTAEGPAGMFTAVYANPEDAPAYNIHAIQARFTD